MPLTYATSDDLEAAPWSVSPVPANAARLLAYASQLVRNATRVAIYPTGTTGAPSDTAVAAGFRDSVCAQVTAWITAGITDPATEGSSTSTGVVASKSLGPRSVSFAGTDAAVANRARMASGLTDEALGYLRDLPIWFGVQVFG